MQIPEGALDEILVGRYGFTLNVREEEKINLQVGFGVTASRIPEATVTVPSSWFQRAAWKGSVRVKSKSIPSSLPVPHFACTPRQAFGRESNVLMLSREGWNANAMRFKANYEGWLASPEGQACYANRTPPTWAEIDQWANIMFDEFDTATRNYVNKKLTPIMP
jgi:hypothetical protein